MAASNIGTDSPDAPGNSLHGVTGYEPTFSLAVSKDGDTPSDARSKFSLPVDSENKAKKIKLFSLVVLTCSHSISLGFPSYLLCLQLCRRAPSPCHPQQPGPHQA